MPRVSKKLKLLSDIGEYAAATAILTEDEGEIDQQILEYFEIIAVIQSQRCSVPRIRVPKSDEWYLSVLASYDDTRFKKYLRVTRFDFGRILEMIRCHSVFQEVTKKQIPIEKQLAIALYKFGTNGTASGVGNVAALFGVGDGGTVMMSALLHLKNDWIKWPSQEDRKVIENSMEAELPKCIGYIDGSHINLEESPNTDPESYFDRKQNYFIQLQAVCDNSRKIINIFVGYPGSTHDARVFSNSKIGKHPELFLSEGQWIAGDCIPGHRQSCYSLSQELQLWQ
ncbi:protein ANTAGONIST OF LIKE HETEROCHROMATIN PROTEIN 1-like [Folsomia candida]|uniref:protein ANTAGONIST OF LIKE HETEROCHROMATIN PROTEIN 1-like n=1 Tax=Folsomia candida TaxID=158441 RepID=UPI000B8F8A46|nr:protein ANTAGONIST OF LIKE HETEROCHROMATIN PROTEIN 1-like [Folsomia candida]